MGTHKRTTDTETQNNLRTSQPCKLCMAGWYKSFPQPPSSCGFQNILENS